MRPSILAVVPAAFAVPLLAAAPAAPATCAERPVQARGEPSRFETLAKGTARGNWRSAVRSMPSLGPPYANWSKALAADYSCSESPSGYTCTAIATPCRD
jgi:hypothetical protein